MRGLGKLVLAAAVVGSVLKGAATGRKATSQVKPVDKSETRQQRRARERRERKGRG